MGTTVSCFRLDRTDRRLLFFLYVITFAALGAMSLQLNIAPVIDEVGVMANAAFLSGRDWSECVKSMGNFYYKPGAALLYLPFFLIFKDSFVIYKCCVTVNMALISAVPVFAYAIIRKWLLPSAGVSGDRVLTARVIPAIISLVAGIFPSAVLHSMYAKTDAVLVFIPWVLLYLIFAGIEAALTGDAARSHRVSALAAFFALYAYFTHTRGIVFLIALVLVNICMQLFLKRRPFAWIPFAVTFAVFFVLQMVFCDYVKAGVNIYGTDHNTLASAGLNELKKLFTYSGFCTMVKMIIGWFYEAFVSTFGLAIIGLLVGLYYIVNAFGRGGIYGKETDGYAGVTAATAFCFLNFAGCFAMGLLFFFRYGQKFFTVMDDTAGDRVIFERYVVCAVGPLVMLALFYLIYRRDMLGLRTRLAAVALYAVIFLLYVFYLAPWLEGRYMRARYFISICTFLKYEAPGKTSGELAGLTDALRYAGELAGAVFILLLVLSYVRRFLKEHVAGTAVAGIALIYAFTVLVINFLGTRLARDTFLVERTIGPTEMLARIAEETDIEEQFPYVFINEPTIDIKSFQSASMLYRTGTYKSALAKMDNMFIISANGLYKKKYFKDDYYLLDDYDYENSVSNMIFVKGDKLAAALEAAGYGVTKYTGILSK